MTKQVSSTNSSIDFLERRIFWRVLIVLLGLQLLLVINIALISYLLWDEHHASLHSFDTQNEESASSVWLHVLLLPEFVWLLLIPFAASFASRLNLSVSSLVFRGAALLLFSSLLVPLVFMPLDHWLEHKTSGEAVEASIAHFFSYDPANLLLVFIYQVTHLTYLLGIGFAIRYWMQAEHKTIQSKQMEQELMQLKHEALCSRVQPHFVFNALNTISSLVNSNPNAARDVIGRLGSLLQVSLDTVSTPEIELYKEFELVEDYLMIQKSRFGNRLQFNLELGDDVREQMIPAFLLQPLVENSLKHGLSRLTNDRSVSIQVNAAKHNQQLLISVVDDGSPDDGETDTVVEKIGLSVTRDRLALRYQDRASIDFQSNSIRGFTVNLSLPIEAARHEND